MLSKPERLLLPDQVYESASDRGRTELRADSLIPGIGAWPASGIRITLMWCINININMLMELFFKIYFTKKKRLMRLAKVPDMLTNKKKEIDIINQWQQYLAVAPVVYNAEDY